MMGPSIVLVFISVGMVFGKNGKSMPEARATATVAKRVMMKEGRRNVKMEIEMRKEGMQESMRGTGTGYKRYWASNPESGSTRSGARSIAMLGFAMARTEGKSGV